MPWKRWWADTLFKRLFVLMWLGLVASHLVAFLVTTRVHAPPGAGEPPEFVGRLPVLPSLPPAGNGIPDGRGGPPPPGDPGRPSDGGPGGMPAAALWLDYGIRFLVIGLVAWFGARWLSTPMRRLADASADLGRGLGPQTAPPQLDTRHGTLEVRRTAEVFNAMARRLHAQFGAQALLMASISHDLRTPLARLRLRLESMAPAALAERAAGDVREMDALIGGILAAVREQQTSGPPRPVDLGATARALVDDLVEQGQPARFVDVATADGGPSAALVSAPPEALVRVLGNLLGNAIRHGGTATVSVLAGSEEVQVRIDDTGPGIPPQHLEAVFQPFFRVDAARGPDAARPAGSGLGLYIARDLTERSGGRLTLANRGDSVDGTTGGLRATVAWPRIAPALARAKPQA